MEQHVWLKKEKGCYSVSFSPLFLWWGRKESSYFKIRGPPAVQADIKPFSCVKGLKKKKKVCPDSLEVCNLLLPKDIFSFKWLKGTGKRANPREGFVTKGGMLMELQPCSRPRTADSLWRGQEWWTLSKEPAIKTTRAQKVLFYERWLNQPGLPSLAKAG